MGFNFGRFIRNPVRAIVRVVKNPAKKIVPASIRKKSFYRNVARPIIKVAAGVGIGALTGGVSVAAGGVAFVGLSGAGAIAGGISSAAAGGLSNKAFKPLKQIVLPAASGFIAGNAARGLQAAQSAKKAKTAVSVLKAAKTAKQAKSTISLIQAAKSAVKLTKTVVQVAGAAQAVNTAVATVKAQKRAAAQKTAASIAIVTEQNRLKTINAEIAAIKNSTAQKQTMQAKERTAATPDVQLQKSGGAIVMAVAGFAVAGVPGAMASGAAGYILDKQGA